MPPAPVSIPYRYSKNSSEGNKPIPGAEVSIPYRYSKNEHYLSSFLAISTAFQFLIGILKTRQW